MKLFTELGKTKLGSETLISPAGLGRGRAGRTLTPELRPAQMEAITPAGETRNYRLLNLIFSLLVFSISVPCLIKTVVPSGGKHLSLSQELACHRGGLQPRSGSR